MSRTLKVCWRIPRHEAGDGPILSFLIPSQEEELEKSRPGRVIRARQAAASRRRPARDLYIKLVARLGAAPFEGGRTFRQALSRAGEASLWWYHPSVVKQCEEDPALNHIIALLTIQAAAAEAGATRLELCGCPAAVAQALAGAFEVTESEPQENWSRLTTLLRGFASRVKFVLIALRDRLALRDFKQPSGPIDLAFFGFWDWSVRFDEKAGTLSDQYLKKLPLELRKTFSGSIGWFAWLDPYYQHGSEGRKLSAVTAPLSKTGNVVILQTFLGLGDALSAAFDFSPLLSYLRFEKTEPFRAALREGGLDFYPILAERLLRGFADSTLAWCRSVALATERACRRYRPKATVSFLEHFNSSRAHYEGARRAQTGTVRYAVQHCSYSREKTFFTLDPRLEFKGEPDGCPLPHPDAAFAMGGLGRELFLESGYPEDRVKLTGSTRYDHVRKTFYEAPLAGARPRGPGEPVRVLLLPTLNLDLELEMVDAACAAVKNLDGIKLLLRNHPSRRMDRHPLFQPYQDLIEPTTGSLAEDIEDADLILFTYSTAAEEAFLRRKPVWQWLACAFNASALSEAARVPQFAAVEDLRAALHDFKVSPEKFLPAPQDRARALERLFHRGEGAAEEIARMLARELEPAKAAVGAERA